MENYKNWAFTAHGESSVKLKWKENNSLLILYSTLDSNPTRKGQINGVSLSYEQLSGP